MVEADNAEEAFSEVESSLSERPSWSDWHNASNAHTMDFAGRWSKEVFLTDEQDKLREKSKDIDTSEVPNHLCYADNPELADKVISQFLGWRKQAMRESVPVGLPDLGELIDDYSHAKALHIEVSMKLWTLRKLTDLLDDNWTYESAIYDIVCDTANLEHFYERCAKNPEKQFLIPVDFHH